MRRSSIAAILNPLVVSQLLWPHLCHAAPKLKLPWINVEEPSRASESYHVGNSNFFVHPASAPRPPILTGVWISKPTPSGEENKDERNDDDDLSSLSPLHRYQPGRKTFRGSRMLSGPLKRCCYFWRQGAHESLYSRNFIARKKISNEVGPTRSLSQEYATVKSANLRNQPIKASLYGDGKNRKVINPVPPETFDGSRQKPKRPSSDGSSNRISAFYGADDPKRSNRSLNWFRNRTPLLSVAIGHKEQLASTR
ncbi:hypothetical protein GQ602_007455 [Ophiocordyceps camponoti-floridani]|uniref:Uncharacterized protein n=1 Tax=Ophiocordyceps camponoti-floridani TaxID=2030778 RepID=A0A8H4Q086_9HYPO|nr:hypothetical protein GQ602_007455 [Ophiocordyceps camponoti-floridani]